MKASLSVSAAMIALTVGVTAEAQTKDPIRIGVISEAQSVSGSSIPLGAQLAADEINAAGGVDGRKIEIVSYDNHASSAESVRAFQRAVNEDHVNAVIASYLSEVVLALEPWAARLKTVMVTPGAASDVITQNIAKDYEHNKYTFHGYLTSTSIAQLVCDSAKDLLVKDLKMKTAVIMSEDAAWTTPLDVSYEKCLPEVGLKVLDHIRFSPDTTDFTPIFNKIEGEKPDVMITGIAHVGTQPTVQWKSQQVPIPMLGVSSQATNSTFWKDTNGATEGVLYNAVSGPDVAVTPKTLPFVSAFQKRFGNFPSYCGYSAYDVVYSSPTPFIGPAPPNPTSLSTLWKKRIGSARSAASSFSERTRLTRTPSKWERARSRASCCNGRTASRSICGRVRLRTGKLSSRPSSKPTDQQYREGPIESSRAFRMFTPDCACFTPTEQTTWQDFVLLLITSAGAPCGRDRRSWNRLRRETA
jgi:branched-chain amino acid transport system substrate-binding protein